MLNGRGETNTKRWFIMPEAGVYDLKKAMHWLGFDPLTGKFGIMIFVYILVVIALIANITFYVAYKWDDLPKRLVGVKALVLYLMCVAYIMALTTHWDETMLLIRIIEIGFYKYSYRNTTKKRELKRKVKHNMAQLRLIWNYTLIIYIACLHLAPALIFTFRVIQNSIDSVTIEMLYTSQPIYYPESYETIAAFIVAYVIQCFFLKYAAWIGFITHISAFNSMQLIEGELRVLRQSLEEIESIISPNAVDDVDDEFENYFIETPNCSRDEINMKRFLTCFLKHHYYIHRMVQNVSRGMEMLAFSLNSGMSVMLCTSICSMTKSNAITDVLIEAIYSSIIIFSLYCYGLMGERISIENQNLRTALYECTWIDKPQWFKRSLIIIMTRTTRTAEMKCFGLFTLNLKNYILALRAAYSYFNVMSSLN